MTRTHAEIGEIASGIVAMMVADVLFYHPTVAKAVDKLPRKEWPETIDELTVAVREILLNKFGASD